MKYIKKQSNYPYKRTSCGQDQSVSPEMPSSAKDTDVTPPPGQNRFGQPASDYHLLHGRQLLGSANETELV